MAITDYNKGSCDKTAGGLFYYMVPKISPQSFMQIHDPKVKISSGQSSIHADPEPFVWGRGGSPILKFTFLRGDCGYLGAIKQFYIKILPLGGAIALIVLSHYIRACFRISIHKAWTPNQENLSRNWMSSLITFSLISLLQNLSSCGAFRHRVVSQLTLDSFIIRLLNMPLQSYLSKSYWGVVWFSIKVAA